MDILARNNYLDFNFRYTTSGFSNYIEEENSAGLMVETMPRRQVPYFDLYNNYLTFLEVTTEIELSPLVAIDPLDKYRQLVKKIDFSEIGTEKELLEEEIKIYFNQANYRKRATSLFINGDKIGI